MTNSFYRSWWLFILRGLVAISFGILAFAFSNLAAIALVSVFGFFVLFDGVLAVMAAFNHRATNTRWWLILLEGLAGIITGLIAVAFPQLTAVTLLLLAASWAIVTGVLQIFSAVRLRKEIRNEWAMGISGALSILLGIVLLANPLMGVISIVWLVGIYAILFGIAAIVLGFRIRAGQSQRASSVQ